MTDESSSSEQPAAPSTPPAPPAPPAATAAVQSEETPLAVLERALVEEIHALLAELEAGVLRAPHELKAAAKLIRAKLGAIL